MKKIILCMFSLLVALPALAQAGTKPFNAALVTPVQIVDDSEDISGLRLNLLYGRNENVSGLDLGIGVGHSRGDFKGIGIHYVANFSQGDANGILLSNIMNITSSGSGKGLHAAAFNRIGGSFSGLQLGYVNLVGEETTGIQLGIVNSAGPFKGLQVGLVNIAEIESGLQIGLANINKKKKPLPFFPIVNFRF